MEFWSGSIPTDTGFQLRINLQNFSPSSQNPVPREANLVLHSYVNPALIPLYARAGPSVEVHCDDYETSQWLKSVFASSLWLEHDEDEAIENGALVQCPVGLLVSVASAKTTGYPVTSPASELLIYGTLSTQSAFERPPSPPDSSSLAGDTQHDESRTTRKRDLRIYAAPLSTSSVQKAQALPSPPSSPTGDDVSVSGNDFAQFFPDLRSPSPKRKRMMSIFEGAAQHHRRVRQRGGEAVSQLMANTRLQSSGLIPKLPPATVKREPEEISNPALNRLGLRRARSLSLAGNQIRGDRSGSVPRTTEEYRPATAKGTATQTRRPTSRRESILPDLQRPRSAVPDPTLPSSHAGDDGPSPSGTPPNDPETVLSQNKDLITRTILTCMRLYGFHRKANRSTTANKGNVATLTSNDLDHLLAENITPEEGLNPPVDQGSSDAAPSTTTAEEQDFKTMYHATYKATTFALRKYLKVSSETLGAPPDRLVKGPMPPVLSKERVTNVVDGLLKLFCEDH